MLLLIFVSACGRIKIEEEGPKGLQSTVKKGHSFNSKTDLQPVADMIDISMSYLEGLKGCGMKKEKEKERKKEKV